MKELVLMRGLPASGKSTEAKKLVEQGYKRINRDLLRDMIDSGKWSKENEKLIVETEIGIASLALDAGKSVVIDDTNLSQKVVDKWIDFARNRSVNFRIIDLTDVPLSECIKRDQKRPNYVGEKVIKRMHTDFLIKPTPRIINDPSAKKAWIIDIDGSIALHNSRSPYDTVKCEEDSVNEPLRYILQQLSLKESNWLLFVSGRSDIYKDHTERWLIKHGVPYDSLFMRKSNDTRSDDIIKKEIYDENIAPYYQVMACFDDRKKIARLWHSLGLLVFFIGDVDSDF